jgi:hypothetical protein
MDGNQFRDSKAVQPIVQSIGFKPPVTRVDKAIQGFRNSPLNFLTSFPVSRFQTRMGAFMLEPCRSSRKRNLEKERRTVRAESELSGGSGRYVHFAILAKSR